MVPAQKDETLLSSKRGPELRKHIWSWIPMGPKKTVLARPSNHLLQCYVLSHRAPVVRLPEPWDRKNVFMSASGHGDRIGCAGEVQQVFSQRTDLSESVGEVNMSMSPVEPRTNNDGWQGPAENYPTRPNLWDSLTTQNHKREKYTHVVPTGPETKNAVLAKSSSKL